MIELVALLASFIGIIVTAFLILKQLKIQSYQEIIKYGLEIDKVFIEYPTLEEEVYWKSTPYEMNVCEDNVLLKHNDDDFHEYLRIRATARMILNYIDFLLVCRQKRVIPQNNWPDWEAYIIAMIFEPKNNPIYQFYKADADQYATTIGKFLKKHNK